MTQKFCPRDCQHLSPTEAEQDTQRLKDPHRCGLHDKRLIHGVHHPELLRLFECTEHMDPEAAYWKQRCLAVESRMDELEAEIRRLKS